MFNYMYIMAGLNDAADDDERIEKQIEKESVQEHEGNSFVLTLVYAVSGCVQCLWKTPISSTA